MTAAIYFQSDAYSTAGERLMGRNAAGESFLKGYVRNRPRADFWAFVEKRQEGAVFTETVKELGGSGNVHIVSPINADALRRPGTLFFPGPNIAKQAWRRSTSGHSAWSLCGITHTIASSRAMDSLVDLLTAPTAPWDALICTSEAVRQSVTTVFEAQSRYLTDRFGAQSIPCPRLPVIPLGINAGDFSITKEQRAAARAKLDIGDDVDVVLFVGRLSFHAKAHPLAMYRALEQAQRRRASQGRKTLLIECGWYATDRLARAFADAKRVACPGIRTIQIDGRSAPDRRRAWACADLVCSLVDNIQETFGIVPVEAMAAGLPVLVSDWDGYRDTVRDTVDGFRIPTIAPPSGMGEDLAHRHAMEIDSYDLYLAHSSAFTSVDIEAATAALTTLLESPDTRRHMGENGMRRAQEVFDWSVILERYEDLWQELAELRRQSKPAGQQWPGRLDPFLIFSGYPTSVLSGESIVQLKASSAEGALEDLRRLLALEMVSIAGPVLPGEQEIHSLVSQLGNGAKAATDLVAGFPAERRERCLRAIVWLAKIGIVAISK